MSLCFLTNWPPYNEWRPVKSGSIIVSKMPAWVIDRHWIKPTAQCSLRLLESAPYGWGGKVCPGVVCPAQRRQLKRVEESEWRMRAEDRSTSKVSLTLWVWDIYPRLLWQFSFWFELVSGLCANKLRWRQLEAQHELWTCKPISVLRGKWRIQWRSIMCLLATQVYPAMKKVPTWKQGCCLPVC